MMRTSRICGPGRIVSFVVCSAVLIMQARTQTEADSSGINTESFFEQIETDADHSEQLDRLQWLEENPFNLNTVSKEELTTIPRVTPPEASAIVHLRKRLTTFSSVDQLRLIENDGNRILDKVRAYVVIEEGEAQPVTFNLTSRTTGDLQSRSGFLHSFAGSPLKNYNRFIVSRPEKAEACLLFEKDAGERIGDSFLAGYIALRNVSVLSRVVVGDFVIEGGQGLALWRATAFGKGSEAVSVAKKSDLGVQPYRSTDEFNFLRGAAASAAMSVGENTLAVAGFYSRRSLGASADTDGVTSFYKEGLFRTQGELQKRNALIETMVGGRIQFFSSDDWHAGSTFYRSTFSVPVVADRLFGFGGTSAAIVSVDGEMNLGWLAPDLAQITLFGELARSDRRLDSSNDHAAAGIIGSILNVTRTVSLALVYRDYSPRFVSLHGAGFGERSETNNERGLYVGAEVQVNRWLHVSGYLDHYTYPWRSFDNPLPASGRDVLVQAGASFSRTLDIVLRYANKKTESTEAAFDEYERDTRPMVDRSQQKVRLTATYQANARLRLRGRIEKTFVEHAPVGSGENGVLFYQEIQHGLAANFAAEARIIFFDTDSYDARVYEFENDVRGVFSNPALYGKGMRWYVLMRWRALDGLSLSAKYSETRFDGVKTIGSALTEIQGDVDTRVAFQLDVKL